MDVVHMLSEESQENLSIKWILTENFELLYKAKLC